MEFMGEQAVLNEADQRIFGVEDRLVGDSEVVVMDAEEVVMMTEGVKRVFEAKYEEVERQAHLTHEMNATDTVQLFRDRAQMRKDIMPLNAALKAINDYRQANPTHNGSQSELFSARA